MTTDVTTQAYLSDDQLKAISTFDDALAIAIAAGPLESIADYGTGFVLLKEKDTLVGVPFIVLEWQERIGDREAGFVSVLLVTKAGDKFIINDGSTGIADQLRKVTAERRAAGLNNESAFLACQGGLTRSDYYRHAETGEIARVRPADGDTKWEPARTYYLA